MKQFNIPSYSLHDIKLSLFRKLIPLCLIFSIASTQCMDSIGNISDDEELKDIKVMSSVNTAKNKLHEINDIDEENLSSGEKDKFDKIELFNQKIDDMIEDKEFDEYLNTLSSNSLVTSLKDHVSLISGEKVVEHYGKRKAAILFTLFAGATISAIGSLTFLVGEKFPQEFENLISNATGDCNSTSFYNSTEFNTTSSHDAALAGVGKYLAWSNVVVETLFYTWTISGILPSLQPELNNTPVVTEKSSYFSQCCSKLSSWRSWAPNLGEWGLAVASAIPLTLVSLIDQEEVQGNFKYVIVGSIGLVTLISNKFFLSLTHRQFKNVWGWLRSHWKTDPSPLDVSFLEQVKRAVSESTICANEKLKHLPKKEVKSLISSLKDITQAKSSLENTTPDKRWINLTNYMFKDLSFVPAKVNKRAIILVPSLGIFTALSWLGLIATVPDGINEKWSSSPVLQYTLTVLAGIPLIEIGLSMGGTFGLKLSRIGDGTYSISENLNNRIERFSGYSLIALAGLGSFATAATLTIQQFDCIPALTWFLLPSAILGMDLINIASGIELWDDVLVATKTQFNQDKALVVNYVKFLKYFQEKLETTPPKEVAAFILSLDPTIQKNIMQLSPNMKDYEHSKWKNALISSLKSEDKVNKSTL